MPNIARCAVVVVANDKFIDYFVPFLQSFRETNPTLNLIVIPFDDDCIKVRALAPVYSFSIYDGGFREVDYLSDVLFGLEGYLKNRMRKLMAFDLDFDEFLYIDTDIIVKQSLDKFFGFIRPGVVDLIYLVSAGPWVYKQQADKRLDLSRSGRFASGFFVSSKNVASVSIIKDVVVNNRELFLSLRIDNLYDQPLLNFFFDLTGRRVVNANVLNIESVYSDVFYDPSIRIDGDGQVLQGIGNLVTLVHWAGPEKFSKFLRFSSLLTPFVARARGRLTGVPEFVDWTPFYEG